MESGVPSEIGVAPTAYEADPPEVRLLATAARTSLAPAARERLDSLLKKPIDWDAVLRQGLPHGVLPLLSLSLRENPAVPEAVRLSLRDRWERVTRYNLLHSAELLALLQDLDNAGIDALVLKGPAVAATVYPSLSLREFGDLDLLVRRRDLRGAIGTIRSRGFEPWYEARGAEERALRNIEYSRPFTRPGDGMDLDLHWDVAKSFFTGRFRSDVLWDAGTTVKLHGREVRSLPPDFMLLLLAVHGAKHGPFPWPRLKWTCDMAEFVRSLPELDWAGVLDLGRDLGCRRMLLLGLSLGRRLLEEDEVPELLREELARVPEIGELADRIWGWMFTSDPVRLSFAERTAIDLALREGAADRITFLTRRALTPTPRDWRGRPLPRPLGFLYFPSRVVRLAATYLADPRRILRLFRADADRR